MIKNSFEYKLTQEKLKEFQIALQNFKDRGTGSDLQFELYSSAYKSQIEELQADIMLYEDLQAGKITDLKGDLFNDLPDTLIKARIANNLTEEEMAKLIGLDVAIYKFGENNDFDNFDNQNILQIIDILSLPISEDVEALLQMSPNDLFKQLAQAGFNIPFFRKKLSYKDSDDNSHFGKLGFLKNILNVFGISMKPILGEIQLNLGLENAKFKIPKNTNFDNVNIYTTYAYYVGNLALKATSHLKPETLPNNPRLLYQRVIESYEEFNFENIVRYAWDLGVCVIPLNDSGAFHGAFWRIDYRNLIILKQKLQYESRWEFDLLHELWHAAEEPTLAERTIIDYEDNLYDKEEEIANKFAGNIILRGKADALVNEVNSKSKGDIKLLKHTVQTVAEKHGVSVGGLANIIAHQLSSTGISWWGTAKNLQTGDRNPFEITREIFLEHANLELLDENERFILMTALFEEE